jgi:two-component system response regulator MprA
MISHIAHLEALVTPRNQITRHARILVAGEAEPCRGTFAAVLSRSGYDVAIAVNGADALERIAAEKFDLLLAHREMPVIDGGRLVLALRSAGLQIPVVMLFGAVAASPLPSAIARELVAALEKPVGVFIFLSTIAAALQSTLPPVLSVA